MAGLVMMVALRPPMSHAPSILLSCSVWAAHPKRQSDRSLSVPSRLHTNQRARRSLHSDTFGMNTAILSPTSVLSPTKRVSYGRKALGDITNSENAPFSPSGKSILKSPRPVSQAPGTPNNKRDTPARRLKVQLLSSQASSLIHWNQPSRSAMVVAAGTFVFYLMHFSDYYVMTILTYLAAIHLGGRVAFRLVGELIRKLTHKELRAEKEAPRNSDTFRGTHRAKMHDFVDAAIDGLNYTIKCYNRLTNEGSYKECVAVAIGLLFIGKLSTMISFTTILYMAFLGLFTVPKFYANHTDEVDRAIAIAEHHLGIYASMAKKEAIRGARFVIAKALDSIASAQQQAMKPKDN